ncbi:MAG: hypothetical protein OEW18_13475 [Candidatus Aminicenantes bacterium]|nr:hypothetical protein [Candidatus Aminicenantes bacterium]
MKRALARMAVIPVLLVVFHLFSGGQTLGENLKILEPLVGRTWVGELKSPDGKAASKVVLRYEFLWNGAAVKVFRSNPDRKSFSEGYFYWDVEEKKIGFFSVNNIGAPVKADVSLEEGKVCLKGSATIKGRTFDFKNTFEFLPDGKMVDRWYQNASGSWHAGHVIEFTASDAAKDKQQPTVD